MWKYCMASGCQRPSAGCSLGRRKLAGAAQEGRAAMHLGHSFQQGADQIGIEPVADHDPDRRRHHGNAVRWNGIGDVVDPAWQHNRLQRNAR